MKPKRQILTVLASTFLAIPALACESYDAVVDAVSSDRVEEASHLYEEVVINPNCDDSLREWVGDYLAREAFVFAMNEDLSVSEKRAALERALSYERHWRSFEALARMDWSARQFDDAAVNFQLAIQELVEGDQAHEATDGEIQVLYQLASAAVALAENPEIPRTRSGEPGGIFSPKIRGFEVVEVPLPITFEFDSTTFDEKGNRFAAALVEHVAAISPNEIRLIGHTDPRGGDAYNLSLSVSRAEAVQRLLKAKGFAGQVKVEGRGEAELPEPPLDIEAQSEEHFRLARRVVFSFE